MVTASLLSEVLSASNCIFLVGLPEGMKSLFPTTRPVGGKSLPCPVGRVRSAPQPLCPMLHRSFWLKSDSLGHTCGRLLPTQPEVPILSKHLRTCAPNSGQSLRFSHGSRVGLEPRLSWDQPALTGKWASLGTSGIRHIWKTVF